MLKEVSVEKCRPSKLGRSTYRIASGVGMGVFVRIVVTRYSNDSLCLAWNVGRRRLLVGKPLLLRGFFGGVPANESGMIRKGRFEGIVIAGRGVKSVDPCKNT